MKKIILFGVLLILMTALVSCNKIAFDDDGVFEFYPTEGGYFVAVRDPEYVQYMESVEIPMLYKLKPVVGIANNGFAHCSNLKQITIPSGVEKIGDSAFSGCRGLTSITIPDSVTSIGEEAFADCTGLTSITVPFVGATKDGTDNTHFGYIFGASSYSYNNRYVPSSLNSVIITGGTSIDDYAFYECTSLKSITIPDSVTSIGDLAFFYCFPTSIIVSDNNTAYKSIDGNLYSKDGKTLIQYATGKKDASFTIPDSVTSIGKAAFYWCGSLTSITIPDSVTSIGDYAFSDCSSLTSIVFKDTSTWYRTTSSTNWENMTGGTSTSVTNASTNATYFTSTYYTYYWYKLES